MRLKIVNVDRVGTLVGGIGYGHDRAIVMDLDRNELHPITGLVQVVAVYRGDLTGAHAFVRAAGQEGGW